MQGAIRAENPAARKKFGPECKKRVPFYDF